jgi:hypothetical protein
VRVISSGRADQRRTRRRDVAIFTARLPVG